MGFFSNMFGGEDKKAGRRELRGASQTASGVASQAQPYGAAYDAGTAASMGANAGDYMRKAQESARGLAEEQGRVAATQGTRAATQAARTAGLNKGQAALAGTQRAGDLYTGAQQAGLQSGIGNYMTGTGQMAGQGAEMAGRQLGAAQIRAGIGGQQLQAGQQQGAATLGAMGDVVGAGIGLLKPKASGGVVTKPTAILAGEDGPEVILPLTKPNTLDAILRKLKPGEGAPGEQIGLTARNVEQTPLAGAVVETPAGKALDTNQLSASALALIVKLNDKINELEGRVGGKP